MESTRYRAMLRVLVLSVAAADRAAAQHADDGMAGWSYRPVVRPAVPDVSDPEWVRTPVDAFLLKRLDDAGLHPAPPAERIALLRRATYDLTGLPPSPEEVDAFLADDSPDAFERVVERLLASPHYGEKWGRHWLDVVRYAETNGYERDTDKPLIWRYRDWVIDAFNSDMPYDRFVLEQIAGDELDEVTPDSLIATGYQRLMIWDDEPGDGELKARYDMLDDVVRTTSEGFLGMTLGCARCHDHKGDPVPQSDYYSFMAFFQGLADYRVQGTLVEILNDEERALWEASKAEHEAAVGEVSRELLAIEQEFLRLAAQEDASAGGSLSGLTDLTYRFYRDTWSELPDFDSLRAEDEGVLPGGRFDLSPATRPDSFGFVFEGRLVVPRAGEYRFVLDSDDGARLSIDGEPVVERDGTHDLGDPQIGSVHLAAGAVPVRLDFFQWVGGAALDLTWERVGDDVWRYTFDTPPDGWHEPRFDDSAWTSAEGGFGTEGTPGAQIGTVWDTQNVWVRREFEWDAENADDLVLVAHHDEDVDVFLNGVLAATASGFRKDYCVLETHAAARAAVHQGTNVIAVHCRNERGGQYVHVRPVHRGDLAGERLEDLALGRRSLSESRRPVEHREALAKRIAQRGAELLPADRFERYESLLARSKQLAQGPGYEPRRANVVTERGPHPEDLFVHVRGNPDVPGAEVEPRFPSCLTAAQPAIPEPAPDAKTSGRRRALAEWLVHPDNPLTARVMVNRIWQHHFGVGIVPTSNDFGELGERPSHPALLDWLASEFVASGWSVKALHRAIMGSSTYRMAYRVDDAAANVDPGNALLWRFRMRRLGAEEMRDSILTMTGRFNPAMGGPSFYSRIPAEALATSSRPDDVWRRSPDEETYRRSVYIKVKRSLSTPILANFDMADTDSSCPVRFATTQPTQALGLLNSEFIHGHAATFAGRLRQEVPGDLAGQIRRALRLALARSAQPGEVEELVDFHGTLCRDYALEPDAALTQVCLLILNLNEFAYLD